MRRYDLIMKMIDDGYTDEQIAEAVKRKSVGRYSSADATAADIAVYRLVHDGKDAHDSIYGPSGLRKKTDVPNETEGVTGPGIWMRGTLLRPDKKSTAYSEREWMSYDTISYDH